MVNTLYSKNDCRWCRLLVEHLVERGIPFEEVKIDADIQNLVELRNRIPGVKTVPQFFMDDKLVGGYDETMKYLIQHDLEPTRHE